MHNALVLCTGNSARSILGEALIGHLGAGRWNAFSAGSKPVGRVNPFALSTLDKHGITIENARSKSWDEFATPGAPKMDLVVTVCDSAAGETCPLWPGTPFRAHWGLPDPAAAQGEEALAGAFEAAFQTLYVRVTALMSIDFERATSQTIAGELKRIGTLNACV